MKYLGHRVVTSGLKIVCLVLAHALMNAHPCGVLGPCCLRRLWNSNYRRKNVDGGSVEPSLGCLHQD